MKAVLSKVLSAKVSCGDYEASIGKGFLVLVGVTSSDKMADAEKLASKISGLRIFEDENGKMNRSIFDENGEMMVISNFTLAGDVSHGRRPSFDSAMKSDLALPIYHHFIEELKENGIKEVKEGIFGGDMVVSSQNDGPCTFIVDSEKL